MGSNNSNSIRDGEALWKLLTGEAPGPVLSNTVNMQQCRIEKVIFSGPATIVFWDDGDKTVVKCMDGDQMNYEMGIAMCTLKKIFGSSYGAFKKHIKELVDCADAAVGADEKLIEEIEEEKDGSQGQSEEA